MFLISSSSTPKIYTVNDTQPLAQAVAIRKHRIVAVGSDAEILSLAGTDTTVIDLDGKLMLPGICDAHIHFYEWSLSLQEVQLAGTRSKAEMLERIATRAAQSFDGESSGGLDHRARLERKSLGRDRLPYGSRY